MPTAETFIGIDVARDKLDLAVRPAGQQWQVANTEAGSPHWCPSCAR